MYQASISVMFVISFIMGMGYSFTKDRIFDFTKDIFKTTVNMGMGFSTLMEISM